MPAACVVALMHKVFITGLMSKLYLHVGFRGSRYSSHWRLDYTQPYRAAIHAQLNDLAHQLLEFTGVPAAPW